MNINESSVFFVMETELMLPAENNDRICSMEASFFSTITIKCEFMSINVRIALGQCAQIILGRIKCTNNVFLSIKCTAEKLAQKYARIQLL